MSKHDVALTALKDLTADKTSNRKVCIYARVLAAGASVPDPAEGVTKLRLTLLLTPAPVANRDPKGIPLHAWPTGVLSALTKVGEDGYSVPLLMQAFEPTANTAHRPQLDDFRPQSPAHTIVMARATRLWSALGSSDDKTRTALDRLWRQTFLRAQDKDGKPIPNPERAWEALFQGLTATFAGASFNAGKTFEKASGKTDPKDINDVRTIRQGDLAVTLELLRAHEAAATVREAMGEIGARRTLERNLQAAEAKLTDVLPNPDPTKSEDHPSNKTPEEFAVDLVVAKQKERLETNALLGRDDIGATTAGKAYSGTRETVKGDTLVQPPGIGFSTTTTPIELAKATVVELHGLMQAPLASHVDGTWVEQKDKAAAEKAEAEAAIAAEAAGNGTPVPLDELEHANQRFFAVQSASSLARLFGMAIDLEVDLADVPGTGAERYLFVATDFGTIGTAETSDERHPFTVTLAKLSQQPGQRPLFWPATRAEIDARAYNAGQTDGRINVEDYLTQENGLMVMGHGWDGDTRSPRFEVTSLDVRTVAETQEQRNRERRNLPPADDNKAGDPHYEDLRDRPIERQSMLTAGLTVLDRAREHTAAAKLAVRTAQGEERKKKGAVLIDGDELTVGYRPDIGVWSANNGYEWRGLMNREVAFGATGNRDDMKLVQKLLTTLTGEIGSEARTMLDSASLSTPMRLMEEVAKSGAAPGRATIVEEIVTTWDGGPMGIDCSGPDSIKKVVDDLPIGRDISLPQGDDDKVLLPPQLRFGWPYRVGFRAVYMGGASLSVDEAQTSYSTASGYLAYPPGAAIAGSRNERRRFLRHERLDAPILLLPGDIARKGDRLMGFERSPEAVVRTYSPPPEGQHPDAQAEADARNRARPEITRRIFVAPKVAQAFAAYHSVFDTEKATDQPPQGLSGVRYDAPKGGFPYAAPVERRGLDGIIFPVRRNVKATKDDHGDAVFETTSEPDSSRDAPYYPDPMAHFFVLGLRHPVTRELIAGTPVLVALYDGVTSDSVVKGYPGTLPMEVIVKAESRKRARGETVTHQGIIKVTGGKVQLRPGGGKAVSGRSVTLKLRPGDDFELVVWCVPTIPSMARNLALVETLGILARIKSEGELITGAGLAELFAPAPPVKTDKRSFPAGVAAALQPSIDQLATTEPGFVGIGGLETPAPKGLLAIATVLHNAMLLAPVDEIGATSTLRVTHAVSRPLLPPAFVTAAAPDGPNAPKPLSIARLSKANGEVLRGLAPELRYNQFFIGAEDHMGKIDISASDFVLGGSVLIDLDTSNGFEIEAVAAYPRSPKLDDMQKRRTRADRRAGLWPTAVDLSDGSRKLRSTADIYGFQVDADGRVEMPRSAVTLLRVENIADPQSAGKLGHDGEHEIINLETAYGLEFAAKGHYRANQADETAAMDTAAKVKGAPLPGYLANAKLALPHCFADGKARLLTLSVIALNRSAHSWLTAARRDDRQVFQHGEPLPASAQSLRSEPISVWLPATFRPGKPVTRTPLPAFKWHCDDPRAKKSDPNCVVYKLRRESVVRVWLEREWFSSGEGEKLGVVLWPPNLFEPGSEIIADNKIIFPEYSGPMTGEADDWRHARLADFSDLDLGPGGAYVTRWGGDPIRGTAARQTSMFMHPTAFGDYGKATMEPAELVSGVIMPIGSGNAANGRVSFEDLDTTPEDDQFALPSDTLTVSLLTYEPRFDVGAEEWYVDLHFNEANVPDPFVRLGLVRYQPHAPEAFRVSEPVVEWTQLLPQRETTVEVMSGEDGSVVIEVEVTGNAAESVAEEELTSAESHERYNRPVMTFSLMFEGTDSDGRRTQQLVEQLTTDVPIDENLKKKKKQRPGSEESRNTEVRPSAGQTCWWAKFDPLTAAAREEFGDGVFFVVVEETEFRHPASYPGREPLTLPQNASDRTYVASGPRFFARVDLVSIKAEADRVAT